MPKGSKAIPKGRNIKRMIGPRIDDELDRSALGARSEMCQKRRFDRRSITSGLPR
jgi:hypothetical protein